LSRCLRGYRGDRERPQIHPPGSEQARSGKHPELVEPLLPPEEAAFVVKARHSVFYGTPLEYVLDSLEVDRVVLTG
jgi:nicotinamidase-related amidase